MTDILPNALACQFSTLLINQIFPQKSSRLPLQIWNILSSKWHNAQFRRELLRHGCYDCYSCTVNILRSDLLQNYSHSHSLVMGCSIWMLQGVKNDKTYFMELNSSTSKCYTKMNKRPSLLPSIIQLHRHNHHYKN